METKHTPGPWTRYADRVVTDPARGTGTSRTVDFGFSGIDRDADIANARLCAAAPDMLAALIELFEQAQGAQAYIPTHLHKPFMDLQSALVKARDAINAATGKVGT